MVLYDATIGNVLHVVNTVLTVYYIAWIAVTPFVDATHFSQRLFPPREYGLVLPALAVVLFFGVSLTAAAVQLASAPAADISAILEHPKAPTTGAVLTARDLADQAIDTPVMALPRAQRSTSASPRGPAGTDVIG
jgi:hypothetical protein